jgi:hypothetical protein
MDEDKINGFDDFCRMNMVGPFILLGGMITVCGLGMVMRHERIRNSAGLPTHPILNQTIVPKPCPTPKYFLYPSEPDE